METGSSLFPVVWYSYLIELTASCALAPALACLNKDSKRFDNYIMRVYKGHIGGITTLLWGAFLLSITNAKTGPVIRVRVQLDDFVENFKKISCTFTVIDW